MGESLAISSIQVKRLSSQLDPMCKRSLILHTKRIVSFSESATCHTMVGWTHEDVCMYACMYICVCVQPPFRIQI